MTKPNPGSKSYDQQKHRMEKEFEDRGVRDDVAEGRAEEAMQERGDARADAGASGAAHERRGSPWPREPERTTSGD